MSFLIGGFAVLHKQTHRQTDTLT